MVHPLPGIGQCLFCAKEIWKLDQQLLETGRKILPLNHFLHAKTVLIGDKTLIFLDLSGRKSRLFHQATDKSRVPHIDLKFLQAGLGETFYGHGDHLGIRIGTGIIHKLGADLGDLRELSLIPPPVDKSISRIRKTDGHLFFRIIFCHTPGDGRRDIRAQRQGIVILVKEFEHFL